MLNTLINDERHRQADSRRPGFLQWHITWRLEDWRNEAMWHIANAGVPALLCTELSHLPCGPTYLLAPALRPGLPWHWAARVACLAKCWEDWAIRFNELDRPAPFDLAE
jgi:hypothetical protein